jgi:hypothetical protein
MTNTNQIRYVENEGWIVNISGMDYGSELCLDEVIDILALYGLDHEDFIADLEYIQG